MSFGLMLLPAPVLPGSRAVTGLFGGISLTKSGFLRSMEDEEVEVESSVPLPRNDDTVGGGEGRGRKGVRGRGGGEGEREGRRRRKKRGISYSHPAFPIHQYM